MSTQIRTITDDEGIMFYPLTSGAAIIYGPVVDLTEITGDKYESLSCALASVPSNYQKGGMSLRYVRISTGKYEEYFNTCSDWTTNEYDWALCNKSYVTGNQDFIAATTDSELKVLQGVKKDGTSYVGCDLQVEGNIINNGIQHKDPKVVHIGDFNGADYSEIQDALNDIDDDTSGNPYVLLVHPKGAPYAPFSMIRSSFDQGYHWDNVSPRNISIVGLDKEHCVIMSDKGNYYYPPAELLSNGVIKNLKFIMSHDNYTSSSNKSGGYAAHIDCRTKDDVGYKMTIEDCYFESSTGPAVGVGLHTNSNLSFNRCVFKSIADANYNPEEGYENLAGWGCVFVHSATYSDAVNQFISFTDCIGTTVDAMRSLRIGVPSGGSVNCEITLIRNVFWCENAEIPGYLLDSEFTYNQMNFGNNIAQE